MRSGREDPSSESYAGGSVVKGVNGRGNEAKEEVESCESPEPDSRELRWCGRWRVGASLLHFRIHFLAAEDERKAATVFPFLPTRNGIRPSLRFRSYKTKLGIASSRIRVRRCDHHYYENFHLSQRT